MGSIMDYQPIEREKNIKNFSKNFLIEKYLKYTQDLFRAWFLVVGSVAGPGARVKESREQDARLAGSTGILLATISPVSRIKCLH